MRSTPARRRTTLIGGLVLAGGLLAAACGGSSEVVSSTVATTAPSSVASTAPPVPATSAPTTAPPTSPPTSAPVTTASPTSPPSTAPPTTVPSASAPPTTASTDPAGGRGPAPSTAYLTADERLIEVDVATGETLRVLDEFFSGDGVFRGDLHLSPDGTTMWYGEGYEDGWYSCETSIGSWGRTDVTNVSLENLGRGSGADPSPDGRFVSYVTSEVCVPDPQQPEFWVLTPPDRVVVRELATGAEREFVTDIPPGDDAAPSAVRSAIFGPGGNLLVLLGDGRLIDVDIDGSSVIQEHPVSLEAVLGDPIAATADSVITVDVGDEGSSDVYALAAGTGTPTLLASAGAFMAVGVSAEGHVAVSSFEPVTVAPGAEVTVVTLADDAFVFDLAW